MSPLAVPGRRRRPGARETGNVPISIDWQDLAAAFALYLVLEGLLPFLNPGGVKRVFASLIQLPDATLRVVGLAGMLAGLLLLWFVRG